MLYYFILLVPHLKSLDTILMLACDHYVIFRIIFQDVLNAVSACFWYVNKEELLL